MRKLSEIKEFENLDLLAKQVVEGFIIGMHKSPFHGFSVEFAEHRLYNAGEPTKNIDWKVYARTDKLFVKRFEEETNLRCLLVIDASSSMYFPKDSKKYDNKITFSVLCAAAIAHLLKRQRDGVGLSVFADKLLTNIPAKGNRQHFDGILSTLEKLVIEPKTSTTTSVAESLHQIAETAHRRSLIIVFSDMFDDMSEIGKTQLFDALQHLRFNKHEVILFHTVDKRLEEDFAFENVPYRFVDMETGEEVKLHASEVRENYVKHISEFKKELQLKCAQFGVDFVEADVEKEFGQVLAPFLMKREKL